MPQVPEWDSNEDRGGGGFYFLEDVVPWSVGSIGSNMKIARVLGQGS